MLAGGSVLEAHAGEVERGAGEDVLLVVERHPVVAGEDAHRRRVGHPHWFRRADGTGEDARGTLPERDASAADAQGEVIAPAAAVLQKHGRGLVEREVERTAAGQRERHAAHLAGEEAGLSGGEGRREHARAGVGGPAESAEAGGGEIHAEEDALGALVGVRDELRAEGRAAIGCGYEARGAMSQLRVAGALQVPGGGAGLRVGKCIEPFRAREGCAVPPLRVHGRREGESRVAEGDVSVARELRLDVGTYAAGDRADGG